MSQIAEMTQPTTNFLAQTYDNVTTTQPDYNAVVGVKTDVPEETTVVETEEAEPETESLPEAEEEEAPASE